MNAVSGACLFNETNNTLYDHLVALLSWLPDWEMLSQDRGTQERIKTWGWQLQWALGFSVLGHQLPQASAAAAQE